ncbi:sensor histidine kinase [Celeribacter neptunius]|uniref:histidine kinase n=1 Tax=Celeribacter neptunius TaxID=588602 RepID=A0A1I3UCC9_9RHOB|nr:sensor histidine kinase [Celeribacter neptunius]SFJ80289.1 two-component system, OmpR family, sensor histidine kinase TctE [Celeribacter neptunius]
MDRSLGSTGTGPAPTERSLLSRVMGGVLSLLAMGGILITIAAFAYGRNAARQSFDRILLGAANDIAETITILDGQPIADIPVSAFGLLALAEDDRIFYAIQGPGGEVLTGYESAPATNAPRSTLSTPVFYDGQLQGEPARFLTVTRRFSERDFSGPVYVTVGQTLRARNAMALNLTKGAVAVTGIGGIALLLGAFLVIRSAMRPLEILTRNLSGRDPYDLTPMSADGPAEIAIMTQALNRFMQRLDRQVGAMKHLISDTAHQLRTPVAAIRAQAELAVEDDETRRVQRLERLIRRTRSLGTLLDQMLSRAMVMHRTDNAPPTAIDLRDVALHIFEESDHEILAPGTEVQLAIGDRAVIVLADEISLAEAVKNMLTNALRYGVPPVRLGVSCVEDEALIWVEDGGEGPPAEVMTSIGQRFERTAASKGDSAGLGLSIVQAVAKAFDGTVEMGRTEAGFRIALRLPRQSDQRQPDRRSS